MTPVSVLAAGALSSLGRGRAAYEIGPEGASPPSGLRLRPQRWPLRHPLVGEVDDALIDEIEGDRASRLLCTVAGDLARELDGVAPGWRERRVGLIIGTSSGAMHSMEAVFRLRATGAALEPALAHRANYWLPLTDLETCLQLAIPPRRIAQLLAACVSSTLALGLACRWLAADHCDLVIAGGYDALSSLVASGFDALSAVTRTLPRPFAVDRDGMALAEGAALVALERSGARRPEIGRILGFGASSDATHVTAPDREGRGLASAAERAVADAGLDFSALDFVSPHGTATPYNDEAEARAVARSFAPRQALMQPWKASIGHALGAGGVLEALAAWDALARGLAPAAASGSVLAPDAPIRFLERNRRERVERALKLSSAFGGANVALVLAAPGVCGSGAPLTDVPLAVGAVGDLVRSAAPAAVRRWAPTTAEATIERADSLSELVLAAIAALLDAHGAAVPEKTAIVVATAGATIEIDERYEARRRSSGLGEPRRFPATSPNLCAGLAAICFGCRGPSFSVGGPDAVASAFLLAGDLVRAGDAPAALIVSAEDTGPVVVELFTAAGVEVAERGARAALLLPLAAASGARAAAPPTGSDPLGRLLRELESGRTPI